MTSDWRKSTYSHDNGCVELAQLRPGVVGIRDSKLGAASPVIEVSADMLADMLADMKSRDLA